MTKLIELKGISKSFDDEQVLKSINLYIRDGEFVTLLGPSGCGKTSLINVIAGLLTPDSGKVSVNGKVSYVFQEPALFPWLTAVDNINVVLSDRPETLPRAEQLLEAVGLSDCRDKYPHQLSGGQKQRIAICRALAYGGDILLLDEPLKGLDADTRDQVSALLRQEWTGKTLLLVTHDPSEAQSLCDRVYRWQEGTFR